MEKLIRLAKRGNLIVNDMTEQYSITQLLSIIECSTGFLRSFENVIFNFSKGTLRLTYEKNNFLITMGYNNLDKSYYWIIGVNDNNYNFLPFNIYEQNQILTYCHEYKNK